MDLISLKEARARGLKLYFTGKPCCRGHIDQRWTCNQFCLSCDHLRRNSDKYREKNDEWKAKNEYKVREYRRRSYKNNIRTVAEYGRLYYAQHKEKFRKINSDNQRKARLALKALRELGIEVET